ncbi:MAG TPA: cation transporter [Flavobacterium sp.]|jgi:copper chaperone
MKTLTFRTDIECSGCVSKVTPRLDELAGAENWRVDVQSPDKTLTINAEADEQEVIQTLQQLGYHAIRIDAESKAAI